MTNKEEMTGKIAKIIESTPLFLVMIISGFSGVIVSLIGCLTFLYYLTANNFLGAVNVLLHGSPRQAEDVGYQVIGELGFGALLIAIALYARFKLKKKRT